MQNGMTTMNRRNNSNKHEEYNIKTALGADSDDISRKFENITVGKGQCLADWPAGSNETHMYLYTHTHAYINISKLTMRLTC